MELGYYFKSGYFELDRQPNYQPCLVVASLHRLGGYDMEEGNSSSTTKENEEKRDYLSEGASVVDPVWCNDVQGSQIIGLKTKQ